MYELYWTLLLHSPRLRRLQFAEFLLSSGHRYTSPVCCFPVDSNGAPTSNLGSHTTRGLFFTVPLRPTQVTSSPQNQNSFVVSYVSGCCGNNHVSHAAVRGQHSLLLRLLERSAVVSNMSPAAAAASHCEQVISVNWSKQHHMWPGRRFWEEG